ncbi:MAG: SEC-C metal-binding domain-containing protein, partial [Bdellovibrionota bacterium]
MTDTTNENSQTPQVGRNEPCPCGSGKKFKRCHGVDAAPKVTPPKAGGPALPGMGAAAGGAPGADPFGGQMDQAQMMQVMQALQRLPRGQVQKLQAIMQKAMGGKDVTREAQEFERTLPLEFQEMMRGFQMPGAGAAASGGEIEV